ncbi:hypothetical protein C0989_001672 [Termitomyces sp. Mn162]|nr:hypothetical protein C0989_001672 [Termitomyces sp. Mn162]
MDSRATRVLAITGITLLSGALAYAYYFDYKRRNDAEFRKNLRSYHTSVSALSLTHFLGKEKKRVSKAVAQSKESLQSAKVDGQPSTFEEALELVRKEEPPASPEEKESYFMSQVAMGEQLSAKGPSHYLAAATCFYRAMKVYPSPMELMVIYEQTLPQPIVTVVIQMMSADVSPRFPSSTSDQNVSDDEETSSTSGGPPSETSSQEWDKVTDPGAHAS